MSELDTEDEDVFSAFAAAPPHHNRRGGRLANGGGGGGLITQPTLTAADIEEVAGEEGIIAQLMDIRHKQRGKNTFFALFLKFLVFSMKSKLEVLIFTFWKIFNVLGGLSFGLISY
jgi:hypothetical protein